MIDLYCAGCGGPIPDRTQAVAYKRSDDECVMAERYHQACWQTGWYTGIPPKGEFPKPEVESKSDPVNHPDHYTWLKNGVEVIDITENFNFLLGNVLKYVMRADHKGKPLEDLRKAEFYLRREIANREAAE